MLEEVRSGSFLWTSGEAWPHYTLTPWFQMSGFQHCERRNFCCFKSPNNNLLVCYSSPRELISCLKEGQLFVNGYVQRNSHTCLLVLSHLGVFRASGEAGSLPVAIWSPSPSLGRASTCTWMVPDCMWWGYQVGCIAWEAPVDLFTWRQNTHIAL